MVLRLLYLVALSRQLLVKLSKSQNIYKDAYILNPIMNRKAITPVIAVVLLLMMTVAAAGAAFFWMTTIQSRIQGQIGTQVSTNTKQTTTSLNVISLICNASSNSINMTLQNTGTSTIENGTIAITIIDDQDRVKTTVASNLNGNFDQNQIITINQTIGSNILVGNNTYGVKITLPGGIDGTSDCVAQD